VGYSPEDRAGTWGRLRVQYRGLDASHAFNRWSRIAGCAAEELADGVGALLDVLRRGRVLLDRDGRVFSRYWHESHVEVQRGFMPLIREARVDSSLVAQEVMTKPAFSSGSVRGGTTAAMRCAIRWGVTGDSVDVFFTDLWAMLTDQPLLGINNCPLRNTMRARQIDADLLLLQPHPRHSSFRVPRLTRD